MATKHASTIRTQIAVPHGMVVVNRDEFFARLTDEHRDIMPTTEDRLCTWWRENREARHPWGWSSTGYASPAGEPTVYALLATLEGA